jgi:hypothetical protein
MLSKNTEYILEVALTNAKLADEIAARVAVDTSPADGAAAQAILDILDEKSNKKVEEYLIVALASKPAGREIAKKLNGIITVLKAFAADESTDPVAEKAAMGADKMSDYAFEHLVVAMASKPAATEFKVAYDAMIDAVQGITAV